MNDTCILSHLFCCVVLFSTFVSSSEILENLLILNMGRKDLESSYNYKELKFSAEGISGQDL